MRQRKAIRIELTAEQREQIREATGKDARAIELTPDVLDEQLSEPRTPRSKDSRKEYVLALFG